MKKIFALTILALIVSACTNSTEDKTISTENSSQSTNQTTLSENLEPVEKVMITEFFDYGCGHCRNAHFTVKKLKEKYGEQLEVVERHFPLSGSTFLVAETAECAREQGKFRAYHEALLEENFGLYEPDNLQKVAESVGIDVEKFNTCAANGAGKSRVQADLDYAESLGVKGTPFFLINESIPVSGAVPEKSFDRLIQQVLSGEIS